MSKNETPADLPAKWSDPAVTAKGQKRAWVEPASLKTLWFNTGTLCNIECRNCYIESSPKNDRLAYLSLAEFIEFLDQIRAGDFKTEEIAFTGGEPFLNPDMAAMAGAALARRHRVLILTNAMKPMRNKAGALTALRNRWGAKLRLRVSLDHYTEKIHDAERGAGSFQAALDGLRWLSGQGFSVGVAGRSMTGEDEAAAAAGFAALLKAAGLDPQAPEALVIFPEMNKDGAALPEITTECWGILDKSPASVMCASSRMVVKRKGAARPEVLACTLIPYDERFSLGSSLKDAWRPVSLNHPYCAQFCVLGGASCSG